MNGQKPDSENTWRGGAPPGAWNKALALALTLGILVIFWGTYAGFYRSNRDKAIHTYAERQQSIFFTTHDILENVKHNSGASPLTSGILQYIESYLSNAEMDALVYRETDAGLREMKSRLVGYGNVIMIFDGEVAGVNGPLSGLFEARDGKYIPKDDGIREYLGKYVPQVAGKTGAEAVRTDRVRIGEDEYIITACAYRFYKKDFVMVMYGSVHRILKESGFYSRFRQLAAVGGVISVVVLLLGLSMLHGIKEQELSRAALAGSERGYKNLFDLSSDAIVIHDENADIVDANEALAKLTGYPKEQLLKMNLVDMKYGSDRKSVESNIASVYGKKVVLFESVWRRADGSKMDIEVSASVVDREKQLIQGIIRDVTARKTTEEALKEREEYFRLMFDNSVYPILWADPETGLIINCNKSVERIMEKTKSEIIGRHVIELHPPAHADMYEMLFREAAGKDRSVFNNLELLTKSGRTVPVSISTSAIMVRGKNIVQGILQDMTDLRRAQEERDNLVEQLNHAQKLDAVGRLAGGIAHDFNNILATISGTAEMLLSKADPGGQDYQRIQRIIKTSRRARDLTMKLLTFARKEKLNIKAASVNGIVADVIDILKGTISKKIIIDVNLQENMPNVSVDVNQIIQALLNICLNACDAMGDEGILSLETRVGVVGEEDFQAAPEIAPGEYCVVIVRDTGPGIPENITDKIFEPFFTTKEEGKGSGLGLAVTHGIMQSHSGHIAVSNDEKGGAVVSLYLPASGEEEAAAEEPSKPVSIATPGKTILVVDDDRDFLAMIAEMLEAEGYSVSAARSGREALGILDAGNVETDLVILDMRMPDMDGADLFYRLKERGTGCKFLICSGFSREGKATALLNEGAHAFINKPFESRELLAAIRDLLG